MSRRQSWMIAIGGVAAIGLGLLVVNELRSGDGEGTPVAGPAPAIDAGVRAPDVAPPVTGPVLPIREDPTAADRVMPYRPKKYLRYSDDAPAAVPEEDDRSPVVQRIIEVTRATQEQELAIRAAWRNHEDGRRELTAMAAPRASGPPILDAASIAALDEEFDAAVQAALTPAQNARLVLELPPPEPEPELPPEPQPQR